MKAGRESEEATPQVLVDAGIDINNSAVEKLIDTGLLNRILAQTEIRYPDR